MSSITRALTGENLTFDLGEQIAELRQDESYIRCGRIGRTLIKAGPLRLTLTLIAKGVEVGTHHAASPMTLQAVEGRLHYHVGDEEFEIGQGEGPLLRAGPHPGYPGPRGHGAPVDHHRPRAGVWVT